MNSESPITELQSTLEVLHFPKSHFHHVESQYNNVFTLLHCFEDCV